MSATGNSSSTTLAGRVAVVTGASSGIGRAVALELLTAGAKVLANARGADRLRTLVDEVRSSGDDGRFGRLRIFAGDAGDPQAIERMLSEAEECFGPADLVVVNAGRGLSGSVLTSDPQQWDEMLRTNVLGAMHLMRAAAGRMRSAAESAGAAPLDRPRDIVVIGSTVGRHISPFSSAYGATKFAIGSATEAMRRELAPTGIRITLIEPGIVRSGFQEVAGYTQKWFDDFSNRIGPVLEPADVARAIAFVVSQPPHVHINDLVIRPTRQDYP
jgi:NADP-dependent 3-hydroxy acid dehydrogenase YdfG